MSKLQYYLSTPDNVQRALIDTELPLGELEDIVRGYFPSDHHNWPNQMRGQVWLYSKKVQIRHHFTKKILWETKFVEESW